MIYDFKKFRFAWPKYILIPFSSYSHKDEFSDHSSNIKLFLTIFTKFYYRPNTEIEIRSNFKVAFNVAKTSCIKMFSVQTIKIRTSLGRLHLIHCRGNGKRLSWLCNSITRGISHHFLFNRCIAIDHLGNVLQVSCLMSPSPTSSVCWYIRTILLDEVILASPDGVSKKG